MKFGRRRRGKAADSGAPVVNERPADGAGPVASDQSAPASSPPQDEVGSLIKSLAVGEYESRNGAIVRLGKSGDPRALPAIAHALGTRGRACDSRTAADAVRALGSSVEDISALLRAGSVEQRHGAVELFLHLRDPAAVPYLAGAIHDEEPTVRMRVTHTIGRLRSPEGIEPLLSALGDEDAQVRMNAAESIGILASGAKAGPNVVEYSAEAPRRPEAIEPLVAALDDPDRAVRAKVVEALDWIGGERAERAVEDAVDHAAAARCGLGEPYCSQECYDAGGRIIAKHHLEGWKGDCSVCRSSLAIWTGSAPPPAIAARKGSLVCYGAEKFLYFHQEEPCVAKVREKLARIRVCVVCGAALA